MAGGVNDQLKTQKDDRTERTTEGTNNPWWTCRRSCGVGQSPCYELTISPWQPTWPFTMTNGMRKKRKKNKWSCKNMKGRQDRNKKGRWEWTRKEDKRETRTTGGTNNQVKTRKAEGTNKRNEQSSKIMKGRQDRNSMDRRSQGDKIRQRTMSQTLTILPFGPTEPSPPGWPYTNKMKTCHFLTASVSNTNYINSLCQLWNIMSTNLK